MSYDAKQLAAIRKLIGQEDKLAVMQGLQLASDLGSRELWEVLAAGTTLDQRFGRLTITSDSEVAARVRAPHRQRVALYAMRGIGKFTPETTIETSDDELAVVAGTALGHLRIETELDLSLAPLRGCSALTTLVLDVGSVRPDGAQGRPAGTNLGTTRTAILSDLDVLAELPLQEVTVKHLTPDNEQLLVALARIPTLHTLTLEFIDSVAIDALGACPTLKRLTLVAHERNLNSVAALAPVASLRHLTLSKLAPPQPDGTGFDFASIAQLKNLESLRFEWSLRGLSPTWTFAWLTELQQLRTLYIVQSESEELRNSWQPLAAMSRLEELEIRCPVTENPLPHLVSLPQLRKVRVSKVVGGAISLRPLTGLTALEEVRLPEVTDTASLYQLPALKTLALTALDLDVAGLRRLVPQLTQCEVVGPHLPAGLRSAGHIDAYKALLASVGPARTLPPQAALPESELKLARKTLKAGFKQAKSPHEAIAAMWAVPLTELRALGFQAELTQAGRLVASAPQEELGLKTTHEADVLLAFADRAGLIDGVGVLEFPGHTHWSSLSPLKRHAGSLRYLGVMGSRHLAPWDWNAVWSGKYLKSKLDDATPMPATAESRNGAALSEELLTLLRGDEASVVEGVRRAASLGQLEALLAECEVKCEVTGGWELEVNVGPAWRKPCTACKGAGRRGAGTCGTCEGKGTLVGNLTPQQIGVLAALAALPDGNETARRVLAGLKELTHGWPNKVGGKSGPNLALRNGNWLRHATALGKLWLSWPQVDTLVDTLARLPELATLDVTEVDGDLACLMRLPQITMLRLKGKLQLGGLTGHPGLAWLHLEGEASQVETLARIPNLRGFI